MLVFEFFVYLIGFIIFGWQYWLIFVGIFVAWAGIIQFEDASEEVRTKNTMYPSPPEIIRLPKGYPERVRREKAGLRKIVLGAILALTSLLAHLVAVGYL